MTSGLRDGVWRPRPARALFAAGHQARAALAARRHWATERQASWNLAESAGCLGPLSGLGRGAMGRPTARFGAVGIFLEKARKRVYIASMSLRLVIILRPKIASVLRQARIATRAQRQHDSRKPSLAAGASACTPSTSRHRYVAAALSQAISCRRASAQRTPTREQQAASAVA